MEAAEGEESTGNVKDAPLRRGRNLFALMDVDSARVLLSLRAVLLARIRSSLGDLKACVSDKYSRQHDTIASSVALARLERLIADTDRAEPSE